jgi:hypothetical protein
MSRIRTGNVEVYQTTWDLGTAKKGVLDLHVRRDAAGKCRDVSISYRETDEAGARAVILPPRVIQEVYDILSKGEL